MHEKKADKVFNVNDLSYNNHFDIKEGLNTESAFLNFTVIIYSAINDNIFVSGNFLDYL